MNRILDRYYKRPLLYDIIATLVILGILAYLEFNRYVQFDFDKDSTSVGSVGLTVSGFILTLLTILLTLKSNSIIKDQKITNGSNAFQVFLASDLYKKTTSVLKNGVIILMVISFITLAISVLAKSVYEEYGFYINGLCLIFILLTFLRCFNILNLIFNMQDNHVR